MDIGIWQYYDATFSCVTKSNRKKVKKKIRLFENKQPTKLCRVFNFLWILLSNVRRFAFDDISGHVRLVFSIFDCLFPVGPKLSGKLSWKTILNISSSGRVNVKKKLFIKINCVGSRSSFRCFMYNIKWVIKKKKEILRN